MSERDGEAKQHETVEAEREEMEIRERRRARRER